MEQLTNGKFQVGNQFGKNKAGKKHLQTLVKESLQDSISDFDNLLYELSISFLKSPHLNIRFSAWKELLKYRLVKSKEIKDSFNHARYEDIIRQIKERAKELEEESMSDNGTYKDSKIEEK
ncbi:MAG: hypothetical protein M3R36_05950 [Bacteroidota bacterium]|nr:hypothetical protein [Bacteroidota bacterium]